MGHESTPKILFTKGGGQWLDKQLQSGADALGLDWQTNIKQAKAIVKDQVTLQGNMDPSILLSDTKAIEKNVMSILDDYGHGERHIFNLGHGITQFTPPENVSCMLEAVRNHSQQYHT